MSLPRCQILSVHSVLWLKGETVMVELIDNMTFRGQQAPIQSWNYLNLRDLTSMTTNWICVRIYRYRYIKMQACTHVRVHVCVYVCVCPFPSQESFPNWATTQVFHFLLHNPSDELLVTGFLDTRAKRQYVPFWAHNTWPLMLVPLCVYTIMGDRLTQAWVRLEGFMAIMANSGQHL